MAPFNIEVTNDLARRICAHKEGFEEGFRKRYGVKTLVFAKTYDRAEDADQLEKQLKHGNRAWKVGSIECDNPGGEDLYERI